MPFLKDRAKAGVVGPTSLEAGDSWSPNWDLTAALCKCMLACVHFSVLP